MDTVSTVQHFNNNGHSINNIQVQIIETVPINADKTKNRKECENIEDFWIRQLIAAFPYGLNDRIKNYGDVSCGIDPASKSTQPYFTNAIPGTRRNRKRTKRRNARKVDHNIMNKTKLAIDLGNEYFDRCKLYVLLRSLSKKNLLYINEVIKSGSSNWHNDAKLATFAYMA